MYESGFGFRAPHGLLGVLYTVGDDETAEQRTQSPPPPLVGYLVALYRNIRGRSDRVNVRR